MRELTRKDLDDAKCQACGDGKPHDHGPVFLHGRCHLSAGSEVSYKDGVLEVACVECKAPIARIKVAAE